MGIKKNLMQQIGLEEIYRLLVSGVKDYAIFMIDTEGYIASWNEGARSIKGYNADEIIGKHFSIFYPEEEKNWKPAYELKVAKAEGRFEDEGWRIRKDGSKFWANVIITRVLDDNGNHIGFSKVTRDLTERKKSEEELKLARVQLEKTVEQLQASVKSLHDEVALRKQAEEMLAKKNKELEISNTDLEQFAYAASHDLKEPLRMIGSYSNLLIKSYSSEDPDTSVYAKFIREGVINMQSLINGLLDYSRIGRSDIKFTEVDLNVILNDVKISLAEQISETNTKLTIDKLPHVLGIHSLLSNLFQNLIANAIKFRKNAVDPVIEINAEDQGDDLLFSVKDNGIGIKKEYQNKIFIIFQRLHTREEYDGTGLGLAMCKKIVEFHGGKIWVESEFKEGSTFYFTLPKYK
jgi:PAS domain S-box-containing protein